MYNVNDLETFVSVARTGGVSSAARALGISIATTSHRINKLETALKVMLFHRNSRSLKLTDEGFIFLERVEPILSNLHDAEAEAGNAQARLRGNLRVTMSPWILARFIMPNLSRFQADNPDLTLDFLAVDRFVSLVEEGIDCAIRVGQLQDSALVARKLADNDRILCAAPDYLQSAGEPNDVDDLALHRWVCLPWQTQFEVRVNDRKIIKINADKRFLVSSSDMLTESAVQGLGVAVKSRLAVQQELIDGRLKEILPGSLSNAHAPISLVFAKQARISRKVTAFAQLAERAFSK